MYTHRRGDRVCLHHYQGVQTKGRGFLHSYHGMHTKGRDIGFVYSATKVCILKVGG